MLRIAAVCLALAVGAASAAPSGERLSPRERNEAAALGRSCRAPYVRLAVDRDFDLYMESPFARAALASATAMMNRQPFEAEPVQRAVHADGYRVWIFRRGMSGPPFTLKGVTLHAADGREIRPDAETHERFFLGTVPSHGIIEPLRARFPEFVFAAIPRGDFDVVVHTATGARRLRVTDANRATLLDVCNHWAIEGKK